MDGAAPRSGSVENRRTLRRLLLVLGTAALIGSLPFLTGLVGALILFVALRGLHARLAVITPVRVAAFLVVMVALVTLLIPGTWLVVTLVHEGRDALHLSRTGALAAWLNSLPFADVNITPWLERASSTILGWLSGRAMAMFGSATMTLLNLMLVLFGLYYLLVSGEAFWRRVRRLLPISPHLSDELAARFAHVTMALLLGTVLTAALQGTIVGGSLALVGFRGAVLWGFVTACVSLLPLFGSALVWLPAVALLLLDHRPGAALFIGAVGAGIASNIDNVIRLIVFRRVSGVHPMATLVGGFAGVHAFGLVGAFIGPLLLSYFVELLRVYESVMTPDETHEHDAAPAISVAN